MFTGPAYASLKADTGMYLNRIYYTNNGRNSIEAEKSTQDFATKFLAKRCSDEKLVLLAGNGKYLSRIHRGGIDYIEAAKSRPDVYSRFQGTESEGRRFDSCWENSEFLFPRMPVSLTEKYHSHLFTRLNIYHHTSSFIAHMPHFDIQILASTQDVCHMNLI